MSLHRLLAIIRKEILHIWRDPRNLFLVTVSPSFLLILLSYIFSFEVSHLHLAVLDLDRSPLSRRYLATLTADGELVLTHHLSTYDEIIPLLKAGEVHVALIIPPGFADTIHRGQPAQVQAVVDGTDPVSGGQAVSTLGARSNVFVIGSDAADAAREPVEVRSKAWYNAGLESMLSMVSGLMAIVLLMPTLAFTLALTREKESGTLEGLIVTPVTGLEYVGGKLLAYIAAGLVSAFFAWAVAVLWFRVPFRGSLPVYLLLTAVYYLACMGAAVVIANFVASQQTAMFIVLLAFLVPSFFLAGLVMPVSTESLRSILTSYLLPSTHFVEISRTVFLKGLGVRYLLRQTLALLGMGLGALLIGLRLFRKKV